MEIIDKIVSSQYPPNDRNVIWENNGKLFKIINGKWKEISSGGGGSTISASVEQTDNGAIISITDNEGTTTATVDNGKTPIKGTDYWTESDKQEVIAEATAEIVNPIVYKGTLGVSGTITSLPTASEGNHGWQYKVITAGTYNGVSANVNDSFTSNGSQWLYSPSKEAIIITSLVVEGDKTQKTINAEVSSKLRELFGQESVTTTYSYENFTDGRYHDLQVGDTLTEANIDTNTYYCKLAPFEVKGGDVLLISVKSGGVGGQGYIITDSELKVTRTIRTSSEFFSNPITLTIQEGEKYAYICSQQKSLPSDYTTANIFVEVLSKGNEGEIPNIKGRLNDIEVTEAEMQADINTFKGDIVLSKSSFDIGGITINNSGWTYANNSKRTRSKEGVTFALEKGTKVMLNDYSKGRFYIGGRKSDGAYFFKGWITSGEYECPYDAQYVLCLAMPDGQEVAQTSIDALYNLLVVKGAKSLTSAIERIGSLENKCRNTNYFVNLEGGIVRHASSSRCGYRSNSALAVTANAQLGIKAIENDVRMTQDGVFVLWHDETILVNGVAVAVESTNYQDIADGYSDGLQTITTLEEELQLCKAYDMKLLCEIKQSASYPWNIADVERVVQLCMEYLGYDNFAIMSMQTTLLQSLRVKNKLVTIGYVVSQPNLTIDKITLNGYDFIDFSLTSYINNVNGMQAYIDGLVENNIPVAVWTLEGADTMRYRTKKGWRFITSNVVIGKGNHISHYYIGGNTFPNEEYLTHDGVVSNGMLSLAVGNKITYSLTHQHKGVFVCTIGLRSGRITINDVNRMTPYAPEGNSFTSGKWRYSVERGEIDWEPKFEITAEEDSLIDYLEIIEYDF